MVLLQTALAEQPPLLISQALIAIEEKDDKERGVGGIDVFLLESLRNKSYFRMAGIGLNIDNSKECKALDVTGEFYQTFNKYCKKEVRIQEYKII